MICFKLLLTSIVFFVFFMIVAAFDDAEKRKSKEEGKASIGIIPEEWEVWCGFGAVVSFLLIFIFAIATVWNL